MENFNLIVSDVDFARLMAMPLTPDLRDELYKATVVPIESIGRNVVTMGAQVSYRDLKTNQLRKVEIVFPEDADPAQGKVSVIAPVGAALIGLSVGQEIQWYFPDNSVHRLIAEGVTQPTAAT